MYKSGCGLSLIAAERAALALITFEGSAKQSANEVVFV